jgi:hypothetical protein
VPCAGLVAGAITASVAFAPDGIAQLSLRQIAVFARIHSMTGAGLYQANHVIHALHALYIFFKFTDFYTHKIDTLFRIFDNMVTNLHIFSLSF